MAYVISISNPDTGTGKTVSALNIAFSLSLLEKKTLLINCDPYGAICRDDGQPSHLSDLILGYTGPSKLPVNYLNDYYYYISSSDELDKCEQALSGNQKPERVLKQVIRYYDDQFDFIIFDTPSRQGFMTVSAFVASNSVLIPVRGKPMVCEQLLETLTLLKYVRRKFNDRLRIGGVFQILSEKNGIKQSGVLGLPEKFGEILFSADIPFCHSVKKGAGRQQAAGCLDIKSPGAQAYLKLSEELLYESHSI